MKKGARKAERIVMQDFPLYNRMADRARMRHEALCSPSEAQEILLAAFPKPELKEHIEPLRWPDTPEYDISVIVPCFQVENFVGACIESCLNQKTSRSFEVIAVDDGSRDNTGVILDSIKARDSRLKVIHQENRGLSGARNTGIAHASGASLIFVDSDDMLKPGALEALADAYEKSGCDFVTASYDNMSEDGKFIIPIRGRRKYGTAWARLYSREIWRDLEFPEGYWFEDTVQGFCIDGRFSEYYLDKSVYLYRRNSSGISKRHSESKRGLESFWIVEELLDKTKELGIPYDQTLHNRVILQLGPLLYDRCAALDEREKEALFVCSCDLLKRWGGNYTCTLDGHWNDLEEALRTQNYTLWKLAVHSIR